MNITNDLKPLIKNVTELYNDPANARHGHDIDGIASSLKAYGQLKPIVALPDGKIIAGNGTYKAAVSLGWGGVACVIVDHDPVTATGFAIADNRLGDLSSFDFDVLGDLLGSLPNGVVTGFSEDEINEIINPLNVDFKEFDESIADSVDYIDCPHCGEKFPK